MYHELKRIQEYEHPHYFRSKHEAAMHLRNSWDETGKEAHARRTNTRLVSKILKTSDRFLSWYSTLLETAEISRYFEMMCLLTLELSRLSSCQMLPCAASKSVTKKPTPSTVFDPASSCGPKWDSVQSGKGRVRNHQNWWDKIGKNKCKTR